MKSCRFYGIAILVLCSALFMSCGDEKIQKGLEFTFAAPANTDSSIVNEIARTLAARMKAYGLREQDFEISTAATNITIRMPVEVVSRETIFIISAAGKMTFYETYQYTEVIGFIMMADSIYSHVIGMPIDSATNQPERAIAQYSMPTFEQVNMMTQGGYHSNEFAVPIFNVLEKDTATVMKILKHDSTRHCFPKNCRFNWHPALSDSSEEGIFSLIACKTGPSSSLSAGKIIDGECQNLTATFYQLSLTLDEFEKARFQQLTTQNFGKAVAIDIDGIIWSYPMITGPISNGVVSITGGDPVVFSALEAILKGGPYPVPLRYVRETAF